MEPYNAASSASSIFTLTGKVIRSLGDVKHADKERRKLYDQLCLLEPVVERLQLRLDEASSIMPQSDPSKQLKPWGRGLDSLKRLKDELMKTLQTLKEEVTAEKGMEKVKDRVTHPWKKEKFEVLMEEIGRYCKAIELVLAQDIVDLAQSNNLVLMGLVDDVQAVISTTGAVKLDGEDTNSRVKNIEAMSINADPRIKQIASDTNDSKVTLLELRDRMQRVELRGERTQQNEEENERQKILAWLSPLYLEYVAKQQRLVEECFPPSCQWFLDSEEFVHWSQGNRPWQLQCFGVAGSGKTTLSAMAVNSIQHKVDNTAIPVLFVYLNQKTSVTQTRKNLLGSILSQLITMKDPKSLPALRKVYRQSKNGTIPPQLSESCLSSTGCSREGCIRDMLYAELKSYQLSYLVVDARDECKEDIRFWLEDELNNLQDAGVSIMTTSRMIEPTASKPVYCDVCPPKEVRRSLRLYWRCLECLVQQPEDAPGFDVCQHCIDQGATCFSDSSHELRETSQVEVFIRTPDEAMKEYIKFEMMREIGDGRRDQRRDERLHTRMRAPRLGRILRNNPDILEIILKTIVEKSDGVFLFPKLYVKTLKGQQSPETVFHSLQSLPTTLPEMYETSMLTRVLSQDPKEDSETAIAILSILTVALQPISLAALLHALAVRMHDSVINPFRMIDKELVLEVTQGLVVIDSHPDPSRAIVRLFHLSLNEYLEETSLRWFPDAHSNLAATCLSYLNLSEFAEPCTRHLDFHSKIPAYPFITYAAQHFGEHIHNCLAKSGEITELERLTAEYLSSGRRVAALSQAAWCTQRHCAGGWDVRRRVEGLHIAAWFGLDRIIPLLISSYGADIIDAREQTYWQTPLHYACRRGHVKAVRQLLELGANANIRSGRGRTALIEAVEASQNEVVNELLELAGDVLDVNEVYRADFERTPLQLAVRRVNESAVRRLLSHVRTDVNLQDTGGYTALCHAVITHASLTSRLEENKEYANAKVSQEKLSTSKGILQLLLERGPDLERVDSQGRSALILAAEANDAVAVQMLLDNGADPLLKDNQNGGMALHRAAERGHVKVLEIMTDRVSRVHCLDTHYLDDDQRSLLHCASGSDSLEAPDVVRLLSEKGMNVNLKDCHGITPLHEASRSGSIDTVHTLIELGALTSSKDNFSRTPQHVAWLYERDDLLPMLEDEIEGDAFTNWTRPLWSLAKIGNSDHIAKVLTDEPNKIDEEREHVTRDTALHFAVRAFQNESLKQLVHFETSLNLSNRCGRTPLHVAAFCNNQDATKILAVKKADLNKRDKWDTTPIMIAQAKWHYDLAVILCAAEADISMRELDLETMLFRAVELNNADAVRHLVDRGVDILSKDEHFKTALEVAMEKGEEADEICQILSSRTFFIKTDSEKTPDIPMLVPGRATSQPFLSTFRIPADAVEEPCRSSSVPL